MSLFTSNSGDEALVMALLEQCYGVAKKTLRVFGWSQNHLDDLVSDLIVYLLERKKHEPCFEANENFLVTRAHFLLINSTRKRRLEALDHDPLDHRSVSPLTVVSQREEIEAALEPLSEMERKAVLARVHGSSYAEGAAELGVSESNFGTILMRARRKIR